VGALGVFFVGSVGFGGFGLLLVFCGLVFGHRGASCTGKKDVRGRRGDVLRGRRGPRVVGRGFVQAGVVWVVRRKAIQSFRFAALRPAAARYFTVTQRAPLDEIRLNHELLDRNTQRGG
jgi:hypothetical protein